MEIKKILVIILVSYVAILTLNYGISYTGKAYLGTMHQDTGVGKAPELSEQSSLYVTSDPLGARVYIDGEFKARTPNWARSINPGKHNITFIKEDYAPFYGEINLLPRSKNTFKIDLERASGTITFNTVPDKAVVFFGSRLMGETPLELSLKEGVYNFRLERRGYPHYNGEVEIKQGDNIVLDTDLLTNKITNVGFENTYVGIDYGDDIYPLK